MDKINELIIVVTYMLKALPRNVLSDQMRGVLLDRLEAIRNDAA